MKIQFYNKGKLDSISGGYIYNRYLISGLTNLGHKITYLNSVEVAKNAEAADLIIIDSLLIVELANFILSETTPIILLIHLPPSYFQSIDKILINNIYNKTNIVVTGQRALDFLKEKYTINKEIKLLQPGTERKLKHKKNYAKLPSKLLCISNFTRGKGHIKLLKCLALQEDRSWTLDLYGRLDIDENYNRKVLETIKSLHLTPYVNIKGTLQHKNINKILVNADLMIQFSEFETYSMIVAESICAKLPVFSLINGAYEIFNKSGFVYYSKKTSAEEISKDLKSVMYDPKEYKTITNGSSTALSTWDELASEFNNFITSIPKRNNL